MLFGKYRFQCRFETDAILPPYKGSTFRGVFGRALKQVVCALKHQDCPECLLRKKCIYTMVFETHLAMDSPEGLRQATPPHPFVIEPPATGQTRFSSDTPFEFNLLLFGKFNEALPYFIYAFEQMGRIGLGKKGDGTRGRYRLRSVSQDGKVIFSGDTNMLQDAPSPENLEISASKFEQDGPRRIRVLLNTPLRLKFNNRLKADLPFHVLARAMLRRVSTLFATYCDGEPDLDYPGMVRRAQEVSLFRHDLRWFDWKRYSLRQESKMYMGGMVGSAVYEGNIGEFVALLELAEKLHVGKQTAFGLGDLTWESLQ